MKILIAGELNVDLVLHGYQFFPALGKEVLVKDVSLTLGSSSAICAAGLVKLGNHVSLVAKVGCDTFGSLCLDALVQLGVDCSSIVRDASIKTGITVSISSAQDRALMTYLGAIAALHANDISDDAIRNCKHLHVSSFFLQQALRPELKSLFARAHQLGLTTSLDPGFDPSEGSSKDLSDVLTEVDVFLPNEIELESITGVHDRHRALRALANERTLVVVKLGSDGCMAFRGGEIVSVPAFPVNAIDTTGAGDSFDAGFLHAWLRGKDLEDAMRFGAACGALSTEGIGGTGAQASEGQANDLMRNVELVRHEN